MVSEVRPGTVTVDWLTGAGSDVNPPPTTMPARCLFPLSYYAHTCWQLGDRAIVEAEHPSATHDESAFANEDADAQFEDGVDPAETTRAHAAASDPAPLAASVSETAGAAGAVNRGTAKAMERGGPKTSHARKARRRGRGRTRGVPGGGRGCREGRRRRRGNGSVSGHGSVSRRRRRPSLGKRRPRRSRSRPADSSHRGDRRDAHARRRALAGRHEDASRPLARPRPHPTPRRTRFLARTIRRETRRGGPGRPGRRPRPGTRSEDANRRERNAAGSPNDLAAALGGVPVPDPTPETLRLDPPYGVVETVNPVERIARVRWLPRRRRAGSHARDATMVRAGRRVGLARFRRRRRGDARRARVGFGVRAPRGRRLRVQTRRHRRPMGRRPGANQKSAPIRRRNRRGRGCFQPNSRLGSADAESDAESDAPDPTPNPTRRIRRVWIRRRIRRSAEDASRPSAYPPAPERCSLTWVGEVIAVRGGRVRVAWGSGAVSEVHPKFLLVVNQHEEEDAGESSGRGRFQRRRLERGELGDVERRRRGRRGGRRESNDGRRREATRRSRGESERRREKRPPGALGPVARRRGSRSSASAPNTIGSPNISDDRPRRTRGRTGGGGRRMTSRRTAGRTPRRARWKCRAKTRRAWRKNSQPRFAPPRERAKTDGTKAEAAEEEATRRLTPWRSCVRSSAR